MKHVISASLALAASGLMLAGSGAAEAKPRTFQNCTALQQVYPHGVGTVGARDRSTATPVTTFKRSDALYAANKKSDRDGDRVACEKR